MEGRDHFRSIFPFRPSAAGPTSRIPLSGAEFPTEFSPDSSAAGVGSLLDSLHDVAVALRRTPLATYIVVKQISVNMISGPEVSQVD